MNRLVPAAVFALLVVAGSAVYAQSPARSLHSPFPKGSIAGRVLDEKQAPVIGAMVSVVGRTTAAATTGVDGRYALKDLPYGPYVLSVHSRGYWQSRGRTVQLTAETVSAPTVQLARASTDKIPVTSQTPASSVRTSVKTQLAGFGDFGAAPAPAPAASETGATTAPAVEATAGDTQESDGTDTGETAWRLRHLPRSILKDAALDGVWVSNPAFEPRGADWSGRPVTVGPAALFSDLALSGQINLLTTESFNRTGQMLNPTGGRNVAFVSVGTQAAGGAWAMQGAMTQGDLASWIVAGSYKSIASASHAYDVGVSYSTQQYDGGNAAALAAMPDNARNVGSVYGFDQWTVSPRLIVGYGTAFARYDYLPGSGVWSPRVSLTIPIDGFRVKAVASRHALVPGAEEFAPSVTGLWLPPERTFSSLSSEGVFTPEQTRHLEIALERDLAAGVSVSVRGFSQRVNDQLVEIFAGDMPGHVSTPGHYVVGTAGDIDTRGWGVGMTQEVAGYVRGTIEYTVATAYWQPSFDGGLSPRGLASTALFSSENVYDLQTSIEATIPQTSTKIYAKYRMNTAFWSPEVDRVALANANTRFNVRVNQSLPFMRFSSADWEMLVDIRNMFRETDNYASLYDEALAVRAPKRIVGGLLVKF
jgi:Carboxypeptidase regulatory-like domain/TonB dependent receptor